MAASPEPERVTGRRAYDQVTPAISLAIEETVASTRHLLRGEFTAATLEVSNKITALAQTVAEGNLQSATEHAEVKSCVEEMRRDIAEMRADLKDLKPRVTDLEQHDAVDEARNATQEKILKHVQEGRRWLIGACITVVGVVIAAASVLVAVLT